MCSLATSCVGAPAGAAASPAGLLQQQLQQSEAFAEQALEAGFAVVGAAGRQRLSMSPSHSKGLLNAPGQNNCFLNSAVQVLWHLDVFRRSFRHLVGHACMASSCIFCALKAIFKQFQSSDKSALPPDGLRRALARTFADQQRFQLGIMDDAAECFENILLRVHTHIAPDESADNCRAEHCIPHRKFAMAIVEKVNCLSCEAASEPFHYDEMVYYVSTKALVGEAAAEYAAKKSCSNFAQLLRQTVCKGDVRPCPAGCGASCEKQRFLQNSPDVVSIGLVWDSDKAHSDHIQDTMYCVGTSLRLTELFHAAPSTDGRAAPVSLHPKELSLVGIVCYYGMHYSTYFFHSKIKEWIYFDDAMVHQVSSSWDTVVDRICRGRHQPLLLLYMNMESSPVSTITAPRKITMVEGYKWNEGTMLNNSSGASQPTRPYSLASSAADLPNREGCRRSLSSPGPRNVPTVRASFDSGQRHLGSNGSLCDASVRSSLPTAAAGFNGGGRRTSSVSSNASVALEEAIFEYDTQSSVMSCDSTSLLGSDCVSLGGSNQQEPQAGTCDSVAGDSRGGRSSVPPSWAPVGHRLSSSTAPAVRRSASTLSDISDHLEPPAQFANCAVAHPLPPSTATVQRHGSSASIAGHEPAGSGPARLAAAYQVREGLSRSATPAAAGQQAAPPTADRWPPASPMSPTSPVYIKPPLLYGATSGSSGSSSGAVTKVFITNERGSSSDTRYINPSRVEAVLSQQMKLSKAQLQHLQAVGDAANRPSGSTRLLRPSRDMPMAGDALAAAAAVASQVPSVDATAAAAAESTSLASSTNDSGYRSAGSTSSSGGGGGGWQTSLRSPSSLSLLESPPTATTGSTDSPFDFGSHRDLCRSGSSSGGGDRGIAGPKTGWPAASALPWDQGGQPAQRASRAALHQQQLLSGLVPPPPASGSAVTKPCEDPVSSVEIQDEPAPPRVLRVVGGGSRTLQQQHYDRALSSGTAGGIVATAAVTAAKPNASRREATVAQECRAAAAKDTLVGDPAMPEPALAQAERLLIKTWHPEGGGGKSSDIIQGTGRSEAGTTAVAARKCSAAAGNALLGGTTLYDSLFIQADELRAQARLIECRSGDSKQQQHGRQQASCATGSAAAVATLVSAAQPPAGWPEADAPSACDHPTMAEETLAGGEALYNSLCVQAEGLLTKARLLEGGCSDSNLVAALVHYQHAIEVLKKAMSVEVNGAPALSYAQLKHDACVAHTDTIHRRMAAMHEGSDVEHTTSRRVDTVGSSGVPYTSIPCMPTTSDGPAWSKSALRRGVPPAVNQSLPAAPAPATAAGRFGYGASSAGVASARMATADAHAAYGQPGAPTSSADMSPARGSGHADGSTLHGSGDITTPASADGMRTRLPTSAAAAGRNVIPQASRIATLRPPSVTKTTPRASPDATPCTSPRPVEGSVMLQQLRPAGSSGLHQLPQPRSGSACSSVSSSSSMGCSPRDTALPRPNRSSDGLAPGPSRRQPRSVAAYSSQPVAQARGSQQPTKHSIRQLLVADMKKRMQDGQSPRVTVESAAALQQQQVPSAAAARQQQQRHLEQPGQHPKAGSGSQDAGQNGRDARGSPAGASAYGNRSLGTGTGGASARGPGLSTSIPAPAATLARARVAAAARSSPPAAGAADPAPLGAPLPPASAVGRSRFGGGGGSSRATSGLASSGRHVPER